MKLTESTRLARIQKARLAKQKAFASEVALLKHKAGEIGLLYTMQKLEDAVTMVGYDLAGTPEAYQQAKKADLEAEAKYRRL